MGCRPVLERGLTLGNIRRSSSRRDADDISVHSTRSMRSTRSTNSKGLLSAVSTRLRRSASSMLVRARSSPDLPTTSPRHSVSGTAGSGRSSAGAGSAAALS